ncbi:fungal trichothecene efflux pump [Fusarium coicis]|nr:fungal trichothecene efflux pump [Fusarium coicis]
MDAIRQNDAENMAMSPVTGHIQHVEDRSVADDRVKTVAIGADLPAKYFRSPQFLLSFLSVALAFQSGYAGYIMPANVITIINQDIGPSESYIWVLLTYVLAETVTFVLLGRLGDIFGRRWLFIGTNALGFAGYMICSRSNNMNQLIGGSAVAGVGCAIQTSQCVMFGEMVPVDIRLKMLGIAFAMFAPLTAIYPGVARTMVTQASWRWCYYCPALFSGLAAVIQIFFYFPPDFEMLHTTLSRRSAVKRLDYGGVFIFAGSMTSLMLGISWGGQKYPWHSSEVIATIVVGGCGLIGFALYERLVPLKEPLMPLYMFANRNFMCLTTVASVASMIFYALNIVYPLQISAVYGKSVQTTGWMTCTLVGGAVTGQGLASFSPMLRKWVSLKTQLIATTVVYVAFSGGMAAVSSHGQARSIVFSIISSTVNGYMEVMTIGGAPMMVAHEDIGVAVGLEYTFRVAASALAWLPETSLASFLSAFTAGKAEQLVKIPGVTPSVMNAAKVAGLRAFENAFQLVYLVGIAFGACAIIGTVLVDGKKWEEQMTAETARKLQNVVGTQVQADEERKG